MQDNVEIGDGEYVKDASGGVTKEGHAEGSQQPQEHPEEARALFFVYAAVTGVVFSAYFLIFSMLSLILVFACFAQDGCFFRHN